MLAEATLDDLLDDEPEDEDAEEFQREMGGLLPRERVIRAIKNYQNEMEDTERNILGFLARRPNLTMAACLIGLCPCGQNPHPTDVKALGKYLEEKGFRATRIEHVEADVKPTLTPELYLELEKQCLSLSAIGREFGISGEMVYYFRTKWRKAGLIPDAPKLKPATMAKNAKETSKPKRKSKKKAKRKPKTKTKKPKPNTTKLAVTG